MDDIEDDARYPPNHYSDNHIQVYDYQELDMRGSSYSQPVPNEYLQDNNDVDEEDEEQLGEGEDDDIDRRNGFRISQKDADDNDDGEGDTDGDGDGNNHDDNIDEANDDNRKIRNNFRLSQKDNNDDEEGDTDGDGNENDDNNNEGNDDNDNSHGNKIEDGLEWHPKKQKLKSLVSAYELAPRVPAPSTAATSAPKPSSGGRNSLTDWTEHETFVLLDAWGDRFLQRERKSLRSDEWHEVADEVSKVSKIDRTDTQCRNRIDTLKKKYKKEIMKFPAMGVGSSKWLYFERMNMLMSPPQQTSLSCEMQSQKHAIINSRINLNHPNGVDKTRNSPETTESTSEDGSIGARGKKRKKRRCNDGACSFRLLADSIHKFSKIYEKIENSKRQQMVELERMRMDLHKELETQKRQILERMQSKIWKLEQGDGENDDSAENGM
ncbi:uncharacterized protein LOC130941682 isoform X1 [Arachis stenosperma]|uniref:uncharacterized protein LOC130941682 isoform X1 n=1 Tax=Arachis stenosperma TaxID=217475 RepID=UPI0025AD7229|nr:uncharacterized protein LOC130941682 isoform X1 [Arachis stenosperma]